MAAGTSGGILCHRARRASSRRRATGPPVGWESFRAMRRSGFRCRNEMGWGTSLSLEALDQRHCRGWIAHFVAADDIDIDVARLAVRDLRPDVSKTIHPRAGGPR